VQTYRIPAEHRERVIQGRKNWWFLGSGGIARLTERHLAADVTLTPSAENHLRRSGLFAVEQPSVYTVTVLTSTDCNLGCGYCFQNTGQDPTGGTRPPRITHARLTSETITDVLEFARGKMAEVGIEKLHILFFGGEPLLNPKGCRELLTRAADYGLASASMISNATLLNPFLAKQLVDLGLDAVQVTFDGDRADHDKIRVRRSGGGTFDSIVDNMAAVSAAVDIRWGVRVNVSHLNYAGVDSLIDTLADRLDTAACSIHFAWVGDAGIGYANEMRHSATLSEQFLQWQRHATERGFRVSRPGAASPCLTCSFSDGRYGAVVNADGTLSSCWETAGRPGWQVGSITDGYLPAERTEGRWVSCEDSRQYASDGQSAVAFNDALDAAFLDYLDETGRL
jgi:uncharacterized protein